MVDTLKLLGQILKPGIAAERDAVHIAVIPVEAAENFLPGERAGVNRKGKGVHSPHVGIVDPFLPSGTVIQKGQRFWLYLYPGSITSLIHVWTHPLFPEPVKSKVDRTKQAAAEKWLQQFANRTEINFQELVLDATNGREVCFGSDDGPEEARHYRGEFWSAMQDYTGMTFDEEHRENTFFRCAC